MALKDLSKTEQEIIGRYLDRVDALHSERIDRLEEEQVRVIVRDEEEVVYIGPFDRSAIEIQIGNTDITKITVKVSDTEHHRTLLIHGNEEDVVSNSGWTKAAEWLEEKLLKGVYS